VWARKLCRVQLDINAAAIDAAVGMCNTTLDCGAVVNHDNVNDDVVNSLQRFRVVCARVRVQVQASDCYAVCVSACLLVVHMRVSN
jgi:hypothetical protein